MEGPITERDWKYMRSIQKELLQALCVRINEQALAIVNSKDGDSVDRYHKLFRHVNDSNDVVAVCFDDWTRSSISLRILALCREGLLTESHLVKFSESAQEWLKRMKKEGFV